MKKYYFQSKFKSMIYLVIALYLIGLIVLFFVFDEIHSGTIFATVFLTISVVTILFWFGFSLSMRIQIDFNKQELYIRDPYFIKKINFKEIVSIRIIEWKETAFEIVIETNSFTKKIPYTRYLKRRPNEKIKSVLNELKQDLLSIQDKDIKTKSP